MTFGEAYARAYTGTGRMWRIAWPKGHYLWARRPDHLGTMLEAEVLLANSDGWARFPYTLTSADFSAIDWTAD